MQTKLQSTKPMRLVSQYDAAILLGVGETTIKNLFKKGDLTRIKVLRRTLIDRREIDSLIEKQKEVSRDN